MKKGRRAYGEGSISKDSRGLWVGRIEAGYTYKPDGTAVRKRLVKRSKSQRTVLDWMAKTKAEVAQYGRAADPTMTVEGWAARWLTDIVAPRSKPGTVESYRGHVENWIVPTIGRRKLARLTPAHIRDVTKAIRAAGRSSSTARAVYYTVTGMLESARREGILTENVAGRVDPPALTGNARGSLTVDQLRTVLLAAADHPHGPIFITLLLTGMRIGEVLGLTWSCIDFDHGVIRVEWQLQAGKWAHGCGGACGSKLAGRCPSKTPVVPDGMAYREAGKSYLLTSTKSGKPRDVPMLPPVAAVLARLDRDGPHDLVFHDDGNPVYVNSINREWKMLMVAAGLPTEVTPHWARHSVVTLLRAEGVDPKIVSEIVGHSSTKMNDRYTHVPAEIAARGMAKLGELLD